MLRTDLHIVRLLYMPKRAPRTNILAILST